MSRISHAKKKAAQADIVKLLSAHSGRHARVVLATISGFVLSCWLTAKGMFDKAIEAGVATTNGMITAMMSASVAATLIGAGTIMLFGVAMNAVRQQRWHIAMLACGLLPFILGISTYNAILGNAGPASLIYDMRDAASVHAKYYEAMTLDASGAQSAQASLLPLEASICGLADDERDRGALTGSAGKGAVYAAYSSGCVNIRKIIETLSDTVERTEERRLQAADILHTLKIIPKDISISVFERQALFREKAGELRILIEKSGAENVTERLKAQLDILEASVITLGAQQGQFGQRQSVAVKNLKESLGVVAKTVSDLITDNGDQSASAPSELREMGAAVSHYWRRNVPQILLAVMIDCMTLWFAGLLVVSRGTVDAHRQNLQSIHPLLKKKGT